MKACQPAQRQAVKHSPFLQYSRLSQGCNKRQWEQCSPQPYQDQKEVVCLAWCQGAAKTNTSQTDGKISKRKRHCLPLPSLTGFCIEDFLSSGPFTEHTTSCSELGLLGSMRENSLHTSMEQNIADTSLCSDKPKSFPHRSAVKSYNGAIATSLGRKYTPTKK